MAIDILNIQPTTISRDLKGKYLCLYSQPKVGKTTFAAQAPKNLLLAFEKGYNGLAGVMAQDITKWSDFLTVIKQLGSEKAKAMYDTITIDTIGIAWECCEQFVCAQNNVKKIGEIPWGGGYTACKREFESALRQITMLGYGLIIIAHSEEKTIKDEKNEDKLVIGPALPKRGAAIINQLVDIIGYIGVEFDSDGISHRYLYTRSTPYVMAGSRFSKLPAKIPFGYTELTKALAEAIEEEGRAGATLVDHDEVKVETKRSFAEVRAEAEALWGTLIQKDAANAAKIMSIAERVFDRPIKLSEITPAQQDLFELVLDGMKEL